MTWTERIKKLLRFYRLLFHNCNTFSNCTHIMYRHAICFSFKILCSCEALYLASFLFRSYSLILSSANIRSTSNFWTTPSASSISSFAISVMMVSLFGQIKLCPTHPLFVLFHLYDLNPESFPHYHQELSHSTNFIIFFTAFTTFDDKYIFCNFLLEYAHTGLFRVFSINTSVKYLSQLTYFLLSIWISALFPH